MEFAIFLQPLDREHLATIGLHSQNRARLHRLTVENDRARAAQAGLAADVGTGEAQDIAQVMDEKQAWLDFIRVLFTVHCKVNRFFHTALHNEIEAKRLCLYGSLFICSIVALVKRGETSAISNSLRKLYRGEKSEKLLPRLLKVRVEGSGEFIADEGLINRLYEPPYLRTLSERPGNLHVHGTLKIGVQEQESNTLLPRKFLYNLKVRSAARIETGYPFHL